MYTTIQKHTTNHNSAHHTHPHTGVGFLVAHRLAPQRRRQPPRKRVSPPQAPLQRVGVAPALGARHARGARGARGGQPGTAHEKRPREDVCEEEEGAAGAPTPAEGEQRGGEGGEEQAL